MSPIFGLTDLTPSFKEIGRLRKGAPKAEGLKDLKYFRPDFRRGEDTAAARFLDIYGGQPTRINIRLAFPQIERCWQCWFMAYNKHGLLAKAGTIVGKDGWWFDYLRHNRTGELLVKEGIPEKAFDPRVAIYSYKSQKGEDVAVFARPEGRLSFMIPELGIVSYVTLLTHSWYDCAKIESQLMAIKELAERVGLSLPLVPLILTRRPETVSICFDGHKKMEEKWIINLDVAEEWSRRQFLLLDGIVPGKPTIPQLLPLLVEKKDIASPSLDTASSQDITSQVPPEILDEVWGENGFAPEPDDVPDDYPAPAEAAPEPASVPLNGDGKRPYDPATLSQKLVDAARLYQGKKATEKQRNLVAMLFAQAFAPAKEADLMRHAFQKHLLGVESLKEVSDEIILAIINKWLSPKADSGGAYSIDPMSFKEIHLAYDAAIFGQGQKPLPGMEEGNL